MADGDPIRVGQAVSGSFDGAGTQVSNDAPLVVINQGGTRDTAQAGVIGYGAIGPGVEGVTENAAWSPVPQYVGVYGGSQTGPGVLGNSGLSPGVQGISSSLEGAAGVSGQAPVVGVEGMADAGTGVYGWGAWAGVQGTNHSNYGTGVYGYSGGSTPGVFGLSAAGEGVRGESGNSWGVGGRSVGARGGVLGWSADGGDGVWGISNSGVGVFGDGPIAGVLGVGEYGVWGIGSPAGYFQGQTYVHGDLIVSGAKSAAVRYRDGTQRLLYAMESPEAWFEDFGRGRLTRGKTRVRLDPTFAGVVRSAGYHVFLTAEGESNGLYVRRRTAAGFEVCEQGGGRSGVGFSYRVVARRRDIAARRFEKVKPPRPEVSRLRVAAVRTRKRVGKLGIADLRPLINRARATMERVASKRSERLRVASKRGRTAPRTRRFRGRR